MAVFCNGYGQNIKNFNYGNLYNHRGLKMLGMQCISPKEIWFDQRSKFWPYNINFFLSCAPRDEIHGWS